MGLIYTNFKFDCPIKYQNYELKYICIDAECFINGLSDEANIISLGCIFYMAHYFRGYFYSICPDRDSVFYLRLVPDGEVIMPL